jgi:hypothetical protein
LILKRTPRIKQAKQGRVTEVRTGHSVTDLTVIIIDDGEQLLA